MNSYHVYILRCSDDTFYTGITGDFDDRWSQHKAGHYRTCYTFRRRPLKIEYILKFKDVIQAILFEKKIKGWTRAKKEAIITANFDKIQLLSECRNFTHSKFKPNIIP
ncbi:MAG: GIY-YIG nuclease family protein [Maribacter sp.]|nr:GIY-YIG nuclease family protein [Maribacter sp.]